MREGEKEVGRGSGGEIGRERRERMGEWKERQGARRGEAREGERGKIVVRHEFTVCVSLGKS